MDSLRQGAAPRSPLDLARVTLRLRGRFATQAASSLRMTTYQFFAIPP